MGIKAALKKYSQVADDLRETLDDLGKSHTKDEFFQSLLATLEQFDIPAYQDALSKIKAPPESTDLSEEELSLLREKVEAASSALDKFEEEEWEYHS